MAFCHLHPSYHTERDSALIGDLDSSPKMDATQRGQHGVSAHSEVLYSTCTPYPEVAHPLGSFAPCRDDDGVHYDHNLNDDEPGGNAHQWLPPYAVSSILILGYKQLGHA